MDNTLHLVKLPAHVALGARSQNKPRGGWNLFDPLFRHRAVMSLFPQTDSPLPRKSSDVLFRFDVLPGQEPFFLIQSRIAPTPASTLSSKIQHREITVEKLEKNTPLQFRIAVNAIRRNTITAQGVKRIATQPVPFDSEAERTLSSVSMTPWLERKFSGAITHVEILNHQREVLGVDRHGNKKSGMTIQVDTVDGVGVVNDPNTLIELISYGVGRAKAYGCGLLSVRPL
ncbi:type I-E CRISPR-associated protein Cas6/Cse3/CasE [Arcanobacterium canis]